MSYEECRNICKEAWKEKFSAAAFAPASPRFLTKFLDPSGLIVFSEAILVDFLYMNYNHLWII